MKKLFIFLAVFCALSASAMERSASEMLSEKIFNINADSQFAEPVVRSSKRSSHITTFDVACDNNSARFGFAEPPTAIYLGQPFIIQGFIYPGGTFAANDLNGGIAEDGSAQWPDLVLGTWICRGYIYVPAAVTTQVFSMGADQLITDSVEVSDPSVATIRPVTGGAGAFSHARGECAVWVVGFNSTQAPNFQFNFEFQKEIQFKK